MKKPQWKAPNKKKVKKYSNNKVKRRAPRQVLQEKRLSTGNVYLAAPELSGSLFDEMKYHKSEHCLELTPGVLIETNSPVRDYIFARQVLPNARVVYGVHITELAQNLFKDLSDEHELAFLSSPNEAEIFSPFTIRAPRGQKKSNPLEQDVIELSSIIELKRHGRAEKFDVEITGKAKYRVQVLLLSTTELWYSFVENQEIDLSESASIPSRFSQWPSPFIGGRAPLPDFPKAPSSAYRKFAEALCLSGDFPTKRDTVLDLGGVPGGWTYVALEHGSKVIVVDRAQMDVELLKHPRLTHLRKDAFTQTPFEQGTYVICDIIDVPEKIISLLEQAKEHHHIRAMVFTIKLKHPIDISLLKKIQSKLQKDSKFESRMKHLVHNKAEATLILKRI